MNIGSDVTNASIIFGGHLQQIFSPSYFIKKINVKVPTFDWQKKSQMETKIASKLTL